MEVVQKRAWFFKRRGSSANVCEFCGLLFFPLKPSEKDPSKDCFSHFLMPSKSSGAMRI